MCNQLSVSDSKTNDECTKIIFVAIMFRVEGVSKNDNIN